MTKRTKKTKSKPHECEWRDVHGFEGLYQASCCGQVRGVKRGNVRKPWLLERDPPYLVLQLWKDGRHIRMTVSRIVALAWCGPPPDDGKSYDAHHINGKSLDNHASNLEWMESVRNQVHEPRQRALSNGTKKIGPCQSGSTITS